MECIQLTSKNPNNLIKKWAEDLNRSFFNDDVQRTNRYLKRYSTSLIIREVKIKPRRDLTSYLLE